MDPHERCISEVSDLSDVDAITNKNENVAENHQHVRKNLVILHIKDIRY